ARRPQDRPTAGGVAHRLVLKKTPRPAKWAAQTQLRNPSLTLVSNAAILATNDRPAPRTSHRQAPQPSPPPRFRRRIFPPGSPFHLPPFGRSPRRSHAVDSHPRSRRSARALRLSVLSREALLRNADLRFRRRPVAGPQNPFRHER